MEDRILISGDEQVTSFSDRLENIEKGLEEVMADNRPLLSGELYMTDREVTDFLKISSRTLRDYRSAGKMPYFIVARKALYRQSDIEKLLRDNYVDAHG